MRTNKKGLFKKITSLVLGAAICVSMAQAPVAFAADKSNSKEITVEASKDASKWTINTRFRKPKMPKAARNAFAKATKNVTGVTYRPMLYIGNQVVSGMKYKYLCVATPVVKDAKPSLKYVTVYKNTKGKCKIVSVKKLRLRNPELDYIAKNEEANQLVDVVGGFNAYQNSRTITSPKKVIKAFKSLFTGLVGSEHVPVAYLGSATFNGTKYYAVMAYSYPVIPNPKKSLNIYYVPANAPDQYVFIK